MIGHLINVMKKVGPKLPQGDIEVDPTEMDPEEEHEFLEQLLRSREAIQRTFKSPKIFPKMILEKDKCKHFLLAYA